MAFFRNDTVNLLNLHYGIHALAMTGGGAFFAAYLLRAGVPNAVTPNITELLVSTFRELRSGKTVDGKAMETLSTVLSTAEAVSTACAAGIHAYFYGEGQVQPEHVVQHLVGTVLKDNPDDLKKVRHYFDHVVKKRGGELWKRFYDARGELE